MRRGPVILSSVVVALVAVVLGVVAWRADAAKPEVAAANGAPTAVEQPVVPMTTTPAGTIVVASPVSVAALPTAPGDPPTSQAAATSEPPSSAPAGVGGPDGDCPSTARGAIVDRDAQRAWLCGDGAVVAAMPITSAWSMPDAGTYPVYAKDLHATSTFGGHFSRMTHFVAFTNGKRTGARIAFHSVPTLSDGTFVQTLASVGEPGQRGESSGCIRVLPDDAVRIWEWLSIGDEVHVIS